MEEFLNIGIVISAFFVCASGVTLIINRTINTVWSDRLLGSFVVSSVGVILFGLHKLFL